MVRLRDRLAWSGKYPVLADPVKLKKCFVSVLNGWEMFYDLSADSAVKELVPVRQFGAGPYLEFPLPTIFLEEDESNRRDVRGMGCSYQDGFIATGTNRQDFFVGEAKPFQGVIAVGVVSMGSILCAAPYNILLNLYIIFCQLHIY